MPQTDPIERAVELRSDISDLLMEAQGFFMNHGGINIDPGRPHLKSRLEIGAANGQSVRDPEFVASTFLPVVDQARQVTIQSGRVPEDSHVLVGRFLEKLKTDNYGEWSTNRVEIPAVEPLPVEDARQFSRNDLFSSSAVDRGAEVNRSVAGRGGTFVLALTLGSLLVAVLLFCFWPTIRNWLEPVPLTVRALPSKFAALHVAPHACKRAACAAAGQSESTGRQAKVSQTGKQHAGGIPRGTVIFTIRHTGKKVIFPPR